MMGRRLGRGEGWQLTGGVAGRGKGECWVVGRGEKVSLHVELLWAPEWIVIHSIDQLCRHW